MAKGIIEPLPHERGSPLRGSHGNVTAETSGALLGEGLASLGILTPQCENRPSLQQIGLASNLSYSRPRGMNL